MAARIPRHRPARRAGRPRSSLAVTAQSTSPVGIALARWRTRLLPYLPQLPAGVGGAEPSPSARGCRSATAVTPAAERRRLSPPSRSRCWPPPPAWRPGAPPRRPAHRPRRDRGSTAFGDRVPWWVPVGAVATDSAPATAGSLQGRGLPSPHGARFRSAVRPALTGLHQPPPTPTRRDRHMNAVTSSEGSPPTSRPADHQRRHPGRQPARGHPAPPQGRRGPGRRLRRRHRLRPPGRDVRAVPGQGPQGRRRRPPAPLRVGRRHRPPPEARGHRRQRRVPRRPRAQTPPRPRPRRRPRNRGGQAGRPGRGVPPDGRPHKESAMQHHTSTKLRTPRSAPHAAANSAARAQHKTRSSPAARDKTISHTDPPASKHRRSPTRSAPAASTARE